MKDSSSKGLGLCDVLAVVFIVLKLIGVIDWSWWWVLAPVWISGYYRSHCLHSNQYR